MKILKFVSKSSCLLGNASDDAPVVLVLTVVCSQRHVQFCAVASLVARASGKVRSLSKN